MEQLAIQRGGETPISASLETAAREIGGPGRIVLITDGKESCGRDPCRTARELKGRYPGLVIDVVDVSGRTGLACVAQATGGRMSATPNLSDADVLADDLTASLDSCK